MSSAIDQALAALDRPTLEYVAKLHDEWAAHHQRNGGIGMANHHRAWAKRIRDLGTANVE